MQSALPRDLHLAIIMDGNGRWAAARGWPRAAGHRAGVEAVRRVVRAAPRLGVATLTLYAFSSDNWRRGPVEVGALMALLEAFLSGEREGLRRAGVRVEVIGRRDRLPRGLIAAIACAEAATGAGRSLRLRLAIDYSSRFEITRGGGPEPLDVDLLIRTGGEQRLSDFLLWESAYAELWFTRTAWPDFGPRHLRRALAAFGRRERRFGGLAPLQAAGGAK